MENGLSAKLSYLKIMFKVIILNILVKSVNKNYNKEIYIDKEMIYVQLVIMTAMGRNVAFVF